MKLSFEKKTYGERVISKFVLFPKNLRNTNTFKWEFRWLEKARIVQKYNKNAFLHWEDLYWDN